MKWLIIAIHLTIQFAISTSRVFRVFGWSNSDPSGQKNRMCHTHTSEKIPPYGTYVQGENEEWKKKRDNKKMSTLECLLCTSPVSRVFFFNFKYSTVQNSRRLFLFKTQRYKVLSRNVLQPHHDFEETCSNFPSPSHMV